MDKLQFGRFVYVNHSRRRNPAPDKIVRLSRNGTDRSSPYLGTWSRVTNCLTGAGENFIRCTPPRFVTEPHQSVLAIPFTADFRLSLLIHALSRAYVDHWDASG